MTKLTVAAATALLAFAPVLFAETATTTPPPDQTINLDPFEVKSDSDSSYGALNSRSITTFNAELSHMPVSADIFDQAFMQDVGATTIEGLMQGYSAGAGFSGLNAGASAATNQPGDRVSLAFPQLRGLMAPTIQRDGVLPVGTFGNPGGTSIGMTSNFDTERLEIIDGPQALLYNGGGAGGVINVMSKEARIGSPAAGSFTFRTDQYGSKLAQLDYGVSAGPLAARVAFIDASNSTRRINIGDHMKGGYTQFAYQWKNTVFRLSLEQTADFKITSSTPTITSSAADTAYFPYNGYTFAYLLATNQASKIDNGNLTWDNINSFEGSLTADSVVAAFGTLSADTKWSDHLSTQVTVGSSYFTDDFIMNTQNIAFYTPGASTNPLPGNWTVQTTGNFPGSDVVRPYRTNAARFSAVYTSDPFGGKVHSQTLFGGDYAGTHGAILPYAYYAADSNWNVIYGQSTTQGGRSVNPALAWTVNNGPIEYPAPFTPGESRFTLNGQNYVRAAQNPMDAKLINPNNPEGTTIPGGSDTERNYSQNKGLYLVNYSQWLDGKLDTLAGLRAERAYTYTSQPPPVPFAPPTLYDRSESLDFNVGGDYHVNSWLAPYGSVSSGHLVPPVVTHDPNGNSVPPSHFVGEEVGFKIGHDARLSGSLAAYHTSAKNEEFQTTNNLAIDINPSGLNGKVGALGQGYAADVVSDGINLTLTSAPRPNWRMRLSAAVANGRYNTTLNYKQLYNDQFYEDAKGDVTYADGTIVYVPATYNSKVSPVTTATAAGAVPLTVTKLSTPSDPWYANPNLTTGQISNTSAASKALAVVDPVHGAILTGATGLPISALQLNPALIPGFNVPGSINVVQAGQVTTGYPEFSANFTSMYIISTGPLTGLRLGGTVSAAWKTRSYYYYPNGIPATDPSSGRTLFTLPTLSRFDAIVGYSRKVGKFTWSTQLNIYNLFNHYQVIIFPSQVTGWTSATALRANFNQQPRQYAWTNTLSF